LTVEKEFEAYLSSVKLNDNNLTILLNGEVHYPIALPKNISKSKNREERLCKVEKKLYEGCQMYNIDYVSQDNVRKFAKDIVNWLYERANVAEAASTASATAASTTTTKETKETRVATMKYTVRRKEQGISQVWESAKIGGVYYLVSYDPLAKKLRWETELPIEDENNLTLVPYTEKAIEPYSFESIEELASFIERASKESGGSLFEKIRICVKTFYDTDIQEYLDLIAADVFFTYFQDRFGKTHYIFLHGKPGTGKGAVEEIANQLVYRAVVITNANAPNLYRLLGDLEKGQVTIIIDEANRLEDDPFLQEVLKTGYKGNARVARILDASSSANAQQRYYFTYGFKMVAANKLPTEWKAEGLMDRFFKAKTSPGEPVMDISDIVEHADDPENCKVLQQLQYLRKLLFAYRLLHFSEPIPDLKIKGIIARDAELIKPLIRLFKTHGGGDNSPKDLKRFGDIKNALHYFIKDRNDDKSDSFDAFVHKETLQLIKTREFMLTPEDKNVEDIVNGFRIATFNDLWDTIVKHKLDGKEVEEERDSLDTPLFGRISKKRLAAILKAFGGERGKDRTGDKRAWKFNLKTLERFEKSFRAIPPTIELEEQHTLESATKRAAINFIDEEGEEEEKESYDKPFSTNSDTSDRSDTFTGDNLERDNNNSSSNTPRENETEVERERSEFDNCSSIEDDNVDRKDNVDDGLCVQDVSDVSEQSEMEDKEVLEDFEEEGGAQ
jgi:hypothetical protein